MKMTIAQMDEFLHREFPQISDDFEIVSLGADETIVRLLVTDKHLRPGGTVSGPSMFALADVAYYIAVLSRVGPQALAVTTNCSIDFMRKPDATHMIAKAHILKQGRVLSVGDVLLYNENNDKPVARASLTYSMPPAPK